MKCNNNPEANHIISSGLSICSDKVCWMQNTPRFSVRKVRYLRSCDVFYFFFFQRDKQLNPPFFLHDKIFFLSFPWRKPLALITHARCPKTCGTFNEVPKRAVGVSHLLQSWVCFRGWTLRVKGGDIGYASLDFLSKLAFQFPQPQFHHPLYYQRKLKVRLLLTSQNASIA